jgi:hypothetical protein
MSEPMSSVEIEDVLSSIRRLVSEDLRPLARSGARGGKAAVQPEASGAKLILTPALRVVAEAEPAAGIEQVVASVSAAVAAQSEEWESETGDAEEMQAEPPADWFVLKTGAEVEAEAEVLVAPDATEAVPGWAQEEAEGDEAELVDGEAEDIEVLAGDLEPDEAWADEAEARVIAELEDRVVEAAAPEADTPEAEAATYEEQVLRELVRDIIQEELQGGLGERITRNIRKLVRAEIGRALAAQALE